MKNNVVEVRIDCFTGLDKPTMQLDRTQLSISHFGGDNIVFQLKDDLRIISIDKDEIEEVLKFLLKIKEIK